MRDFLSGCTCGGMVFLACGHVSGSVPSSNLMNLASPLLPQGKRQQELLQSCLNQLQDLQAFVTSRQPHPQDVLQLQVRSRLTAAELP